jgi:hypothetical protein
MNKIIYMHESRFFYALGWWINQSPKGLQELIDYSFTVQCRRSMLGR